MADRSLAFFTTLANAKGNIDKRTGLNTASHTTQYDIKRYDKNDPLKDGTTESKTVNYTLVESLQTPGQFINYKGNSATNNYTPDTTNAEFASDIKLSSIIDWTAKHHKSMALKAGQFAYLKDFGVYPANRLMILRRFEDGVPHDLFQSSTKPLNTMVTYYSLEKSPFDISFKEDWDTFKSSIMDVIQDVVGIKFDSLPGIGGIVKAAQTITPSAIQQTIIESIGQRLGLISAGGAMFGDPNIIYEAAIRKANSEDIEGGLFSNVSMTFTTTYIFREINGVDAQVAMMDILSNVVHMSTSNGRFILAHNGNDTMNKVVRAMEQGNITQLLTDVLEAITDVAKKVLDLVTKIASKAITDVTAAVKGDFKPIIDDILSVAGELIANRFSRYKWQLRGAIGALTGQHTAPWHITYGNPKSPWFTIGNLTIESAKIDFSGELSYADTPTEMTVTMTFKSGRTMGAGELTSLFNNGKGRIYDTPEKIQQLKVPNDQQITFNESPQTNQSHNVMTAPTASDTKMDLPIGSTSPFSTGTTGIDPSLLE